MRVIVNCIHDTHNRFGAGDISSDVDIPQDHVIRVEAEHIDLNTFRIVEGEAGVVQYNTCTPGIHTPGIFGRHVAAGQRCVDIIITIGIAVCIFPNTGVLPCPTGVC